MTAKPRDPASPVPPQETLAGLILALVILVLLVLSLPGGAPVSIHDCRPALDLNSASADDLALLPGIGPAYAANIVACRLRCGPFQTAEDIQAVPGLPRGTRDRLARFLPPSPRAGRKDGAP